MKTHGRHNKMHGLQNCLLVVDGFLTSQSVCVCMCVRVSWYILLTYRQHQHNQASENYISTKFGSSQPRAIYHKFTWSQHVQVRPCENNWNNVSCNHFAITVKLRINILQARAFSTNARIVQRRKRMCVGMVHGCISVCLQQLILVVNQLGKILIFNQQSLLNQNHMVTTDYTYIHELRLFDSVGKCHWKALAATISHTHNNPMQSSCMRRL